MTDNRNSNDTGMKNLVDEFRISFKLQKEEISNLIDKIKTQSDSTLINNLLEKIKSLESYIKEMGSYLPTYDLKISIQNLSELRKEALDLQKKSAPTKTFKFKTNITKLKNTENKKISNINSIEPQTTNKPADSQCLKLSEKNNYYYYHLPVKSSVLSYEANLYNLKFSIVDLSEESEYIRALYVNNLEFCVIICSKINGSVTIRNCKNCIFVLVSQQLRLEECIDVDIYLRINN
ncbi:hypothetical protein BB559_003662, partial [Furculomyces boomerangus]